jgi:hypothetical protein
MISTLRSQTGQARTCTVFFREITENRINCGSGAGDVSLLHEYRGTGL